MCKKILLDRPVSQVTVTFSLHFIDYLTSITKINMETVIVCPLLDVFLN